MTAKTDISKIEAPAHLSTRAKALWHAVVPSQACQPQRLALVQTALEALDRADQARALIAVEGLVLKTESTGAPHIHPAVRLEKESRAQFVQIWAGSLRLEWERGKV